MSSFRTVAEDLQLDDPRYLQALALHDIVAMSEPLWYGNDEASAIAAEWHSGQASALYSICSTGEVANGDYRDRAILEIEHNLRHVEAELLDALGSRAVKLDTERERLHALLAWVTAHEFEGDDDDEL